MKVWQLLWEERDGPSSTRLWRENNPSSSDEVVHNLIELGLPESHWVRAKQAISAASTFHCGYGVATLSIEDVK